MGCPSYRKQVVHQIKLKLAAKNVTKFWGYMRTYKVSEGYQ